MVLIVVAALLTLCGIGKYRETAFAERITYSLVGSDRNTRSLFRNEKTILFSVWHQMRRHLFSQPQSASLPT